MIIEADSVRPVPRMAPEEAFDGREPRVLPAAAARWPAMRRWTFAYLRERFGHKRVILSDDVGAPTAHIAARFSTYVDYCLGEARALPPPPGAAPWYLGNWDAFSEAVDLADDFTPPAGLDDRMPAWDAADPRWHFGRFGWLFVGPAGTRTFPHRDLFATHAWIAQIVGRKRVRLLSHEQVAASRAAGRDRGAAWAWDAELTPGDVLLIPSLVLHEAEALEPSISLSFNYVDAHNEALVRAAAQADPDLWARKIAGAAVTWPQ